MDLHAIDAHQRGADDYLFGRGQAWFALVMTIGLMVFDYIDRQVIVSLFPYLKTAWGPSDKQLGALVSVVSITVALGAIPVALFADRASRVKSIVVMAVIWSLATISCMFTRSYSQLLAARSVVGLGEAGYGSVGAALIASHFPSRMRGALLAAFFASASVGSVLGVMLGGLIATRWGWQAAFGVVGFPGLALALLYLKVRDYRTVELTPTLDQATRSMSGVARHIVKILTRSRTMLWVCIGGAAQLIVVSAVWSWLPSFLNRVQGIAPAQAGVRAALVVLGRRDRQRGLGRRGRPGRDAAVTDEIHGARSAVYRDACDPGVRVRGTAIRARVVRTHPIRTDRARRLPDDLHGWSGIGDRHRRRSPRRTRNRMFRTGAVPEPARPRHRAVHRRRVVGRVGSRIGADRHTSLWRARGDCLPGGGAQLRDRQAARQRSSFHTHRSDANCRNGGRLVVRSTHKDEPRLN